VSKGVRPLRAALLGALAAVTLTPAAAVAFHAVDHAETLATARSRTVGHPATAPRATARAVAPPATHARPVAPPSTPAAPATPTPPAITAALRFQQSALLAGDATGFAAAVDPADTALRADLTRRFTALRAMRVAVWRESADGSPQRTGTGAWNQPVRLTYCFGTPDCAPLTITVPTTWATAGAAVRLTAFGVSGPTDLGPRPWEVTDLRTAVGPRVIVATTARYAARLPTVLAAAERAAAVTDRYARWTRPPGRYVVYLAGADEWSKWYGVTQQPWVAAFAMPLTDSSTEVVLNANHVDRNDVSDVLRHELTHVVTLDGVPNSYAHTWWLVEGIAEYVRITGAPHSFDALGEVRRYIHSGQWSGDVALDEPPADASANDVNGRYGVAFLAVKRLADRFGEDKMLAFFAAAARDGKSLNDASGAVFATPWDQVDADCAQVVRAKAQ
jgi:hypothetical protein